MNFDQGTFNFGAGDDVSGYHKWQEELDARKKRFESLHGIILGSNVRLTLRGEYTLLEGTITLCDSTAPKNRSQLRLRIASHRITHHHPRRNRTHHAPMTLWTQDDALLSLPAIRSYFEHAIWHAGLSTRWDKHHIVSNDMPCFDPASKHLTTYEFKTAAEKFRPIESHTHPVFFPWGAKGRNLENEFRQLSRAGKSPNRSHYRRAQQFTVQIYDGEGQALKPDSNAPVPARIQTPFTRESDLGRRKSKRALKSKPYDNISTITQIPDRHPERDP